jgi:hypothetical protein
MEYIDNQEIIITWREKLAPDYSLLAIKTTINQFAIYSYVAVFIKHVINKLLFNGLTMFNEPP